MLEYSGYLKLYFFYTFLYVLKLRQSPRGARIESKNNDTES